MDISIEKNTRLQRRRHTDDCADFGRAAVSAHAELLDLGLCYPQDSADRRFAIKHNLAGRRLAILYADFDFTTATFQHDPRRNFVPRQGAINNAASLFQDRDAALAVRPFGRTRFFSGLCP